MTPMRRVFLGMVIMVSSALVVTASEFKVISGPHVAPMSAVTNTPPILAPVGSSNLALLKPVTAGPTLADFHGSLSQITDGFKDCEVTNFVELPKKTRWIQIDLRQPCEIYAVAFWKPYNTFDVARGVIVQICNDSDFKKEVRTIFNNDYDNLNGQDAGTDQEYYESHFGKAIPAGGKTARYVRVYSRGTHAELFTTFLEVEVWGLPANSGSPAPANRHMEPLLLPKAKAVFY